MGTADVNRHDGKTVDVRLRCPWCKENSNSLAVSIAAQPDRIVYVAIKQMPDDVLPINFKKAAHHVRLIGNAAAHVDEVTGTDAERLLKFVEQVLHQIYVLPHELEQAQLEHPIPPQHMPTSAPQAGGKGKGKA